METPSNRKPFRCVLAITARVLGVLLLGTAAACPRASRKDARSPDQPAPPVSGRLVYERHHEGKALGLHRLDLPGGTPRLLIPGAVYPRWSPDGERLAFRIGDEVFVSAADGSQRVSLATGRGVVPVCWRGGGAEAEIWFGDEEGVHAVRVADRSRRRVWKEKARELDVSADGRILVYSFTDHHMYGADLETGMRWQIGRGCSASLSPDETAVTNNRGDHKSLWIRALRDGAHLGTVAAPPETTFDNQWWSNHPDYIVSRTEQPKNADIWLHRRSDDQRWRLTRSGDADRPDLFIASP